MSKSVEFPPVKLTDMNCSRGAPMGRHYVHRTGLTDPQFQVERMPLVDGGYDCGGAYWGTPDNLWVADFTTPRTGTEIVRYYLRAPSRIQALETVKRDYPSAKFLPETGSVIEQTIQSLQKFLDERDSMGEDPEDDTARDTQSDIEYWQEHLDRIRRTK